MREMSRDIPTLEEKAQRAVFRRQASGNVVRVETAPFGDRAADPELASCGANGFHRITPPGSPTPWRGKIERSPRHSPLLEF
jgi:hypothetical protein